MERLARYELGRVLGEGASGVVYEATLCGPGSLRKPVALKVLRQPSHDLRREARIGGLLRHRHLVDVYQVGEVDGVWYCALERCQGCLADHRPLPARALVEVGLAVCEALAYAHDELGLVHRDIKPRNLLYDAQGTVKVADLGIARAAGFDPDGVVRGSPGYMAPEQARGAPVDSAADVYALARTLLSLSAGGGLRAAATGDWFSDEPVPQPAVTPVAPEWLERALEPCLALDPTQRPSLRALADALRALDVDGAGLREHLGIPEQRVARSTLPEPMDAFVGRGPELEGLQQALASPGLVLLKGPAGVGKSRLALEAVRHWTDGPTAWCDLTRVRDAGDALFAVADALDVQLSGHDDRAQLGRVIRGLGPAVLVLDTVEHFPELSSLLADWQGEAPEVRFVLTSRVVLPADAVVDVDVLPSPDAQALLVARAAARGVDIVDDPALAALADRLDGLPLALELAAGRLGVLSLSEVVQRLGLQLLRAADTGRHATLQSALGWSWDLLDPTQQACLTQLAVFEGGLTVPAAEDVVDLPDVVTLLDGLCERSWLSVRRDRLTMLEAVRAMVADQAPDTEAELRHGRWAAGLGATVGPKGSVPRLTRLSDELANILAACRRAVLRTDGPTAVRTLALACEVLSIRGPFTTAVDLARAVAALELAEPDRARVQLALARVLTLAGHPREAARELAPAIAAFRRLGDDEGLAAALESAGSDDLRDGRRAQARARMTETLALRRRHGDRAGEGLVLGNLALLASREGRPQEAEDYAGMALRIHREVGNRQYEGIVLSNRGSARRMAGRLDEGAQDLLEAIAIQRDLGNRRSEGVALHNLASLRGQQGRHDEADELMEQALRACRAVGNRKEEARVLRDHGVHLFGRRQLAEARRCFESAHGIHREVGDRFAEAVAEADLGLLHVADEEEAEARAHFEAALATHLELGRGHQAGHVQGFLGNSYLREGRLPEARHHLQAGLALLETYPDLVAWSMLQLALAKVDTREGDHASARERLDQAEPHLRSHGDVARLADFLADRAILVHQAGDAELARASLVEAREVAPPGDVMCEEHIARAEAVLAGGAPDQEGQ